MISFFNKDFEKSKKAKREIKLQWAASMNSHYVVKIKDVYENLNFYFVIME